MERGNSYLVEDECIMSERIFLMDRSHQTNHGGVSFACCFIITPTINSCASSLLVASLRYNNTIAQKDTRMFV